MKLFIEHDFINWNEYIDIERSNKYKANKIKQSEKKGKRLIKIDE